MEEKNRCWNCMEKKPVRFRICPHCGYAEDTPYDPNYAPPGTELNDHYTLGVKIGHNSEGANYIGYNSSIGCKVLIREYMPIGLCKRVRGRATISVYPNQVVQYKALMAEFTELNKNLAQMRNLPHIIPTLDMFSVNNTTYVVYEYLEGIKLVEFLNDNAGELSWNQVSELFPTFFTTLSLMHNNNVIHRAISPDTIYVTPKGELRLCGFSIYSVRTVHLELPCELFSGYAAPEQYTPGAKQGTFTDVYGICAVLYRILTGCKPTEAPSRIQNDNLCPPREMNSNIPQNVSDAIMKGMNLDSQSRTQTITEFVTQLFEQSEPSAPVKIIPPDTPQKHNKKPHASDDENIDYPIHEESIIDRIRMPLIIAVMFLCIFLVLAIIFLNFMNPGSVSPGQSAETTTVTEPSENNIVTEPASESEPLTTEAQGDSQMPALVGMSYEIKKQQLETDGWLYLEPIYAYSDNYKAGIIIEQAIEAGQPFTSGETVRVVVSKGPSTIQLPDYHGKTLKDYEAELEALGLTNYNTEAVVNYSFDTGYVIELNKEAGEIFDLTGEDTLKIFYASNPETTQVIIVTEITQVTEIVTEPPVVIEPVTEATEPEETEPTEPSEEEFETAPSVAPDIAEESTSTAEPGQDITEEAPLTAPPIETEAYVETAPPVPDDFQSQ